MKRIKFVVYASTGGIIFIVSMVRSRNLPIVKRIKLSGKQSLKAFVVGMSLRLGKERWQDVLDMDNSFITNKTPTVSTRFSTQNSNQSIKRSRLITSDDELEALGFVKNEDTSKEVTLVVGIPTPYSSKKRFSIHQESLDGLVQESHIPMSAEQKPKILMSRIKSDLKDPLWVKEFILSIKHGGAQDPDEKLIKSILSKVSESHFDLPSVNKILKKIAEVTLEVGSNSKLMRILAEFDRPFTLSRFDGMERILPQDILRFPGAESWIYNPTPSLSPHHRRFQTKLLSAQTPNGVCIIAQDGVTGLLTDKSTNHLLAKHGNSLGIDDPLPPNPNQKTKKHEQIRTRINKPNKQQFTDTLKEILQDPNTEVFPNASIRGTRGNVYYTQKYGQEGFLIGIHTEGKFAGQIQKAQPVSPEQLERLRTSNSID